MRKMSKKSRKELAKEAHAIRSTSRGSIGLVLLFCASAAAVPIFARAIFAQEYHAERLDKARRIRQRNAPTGFRPLTLADPVSPPERAEPFAPVKRIRSSAALRAKAAAVTRTFRPVVAAPVPVVMFEDAPYPVFGRVVAKLKARRALSAKERRVLRAACRVYNLRPDAPWFSRAKIEFQFARECYVAVFTDRDGETRHATASVLSRDWHGALATLAASMQRARTSIALPVLKRHG